jgi:hypothetical protein
MNDVSDALSAPTEGVILSLEQCDELLVSGMHSIRDAILGYTTKGLTQPQISERVKALGFKASLRTVQNHVADLRKEGLLPAVQPSLSAEAVRQRRHRASVTTRNFCGMSQPSQQPVPLTNTDFHSNHDCILVSSEPIHAVQPFSGRVPGIQPELEPHCAGQYEATVSMGTEADRDYQRCLDIFEELCQITGRYITGGWTEEQWNGLGGECRTLEDCCNIHSADLRKRFERSRQEFLDSFNAKGAPGICEGVADSDS